MSKEQLTVDFLKTMSIIDTSLLNFHIKIEGENQFKSVNHGCRICFRDVPKQIPNIEFYFSCELNKLIDNNLHSLSFNISIYKEEKWFFDGFVDFDGYDGGYTNLSVEEEYGTLEELISNCKNDYSKVEEGFFKGYAKRIKVIE